MKSTIIFCVFVALAYGADPIHKVTPLSDEMINKINSIGTTWKAGKNFEGLSLSHVERLLGVKVLHLRSNILKVQYSLNGSLPEHFDAREAWPSCPSIGLIRDQGSCGSSWAFGAVEAMSDRICIASKGTKKVDLSVEDVLTCCGVACGDGCDGGYPELAWYYYKAQGIVSGGLYNGTGCQPYTIPPCVPYESGLGSGCRKQSTPACLHRCAFGDYSALTSYKSDKHFGQTPYTLQSTRQIMIEIMTNGPVEADFSVYSDFPSYKTGVYQRTLGTSYLGGHAIKILGWGVENGVDYWLAANSWGTHWGDKGYFKIKRGNNECGIEKDILASIPTL